MPVRRAKPSWAKIVAGALVMAALAAAWRYTPLANYLTPHRIAGWAHLARQSRWAPLLVVLAYTPAAFILFPRPLLTLISVIAFGAWLGFAYAVVGILAAALATYAIGRFTPYEKVRRIAGDALDDATQIFRGHAVAGVFAANMVPVPPFGVQGIIAGAMRLSVWQYALGTLLSLLPGAIALAFFGEQLSTAMQDPGEASGWLLAAPVTGFAIFFVLARRWARRRS